MLLSPGKLARVAFQQLVQAQEPGGGPDPVPALGGGYPPHLQAESHVPSDAHVGIEGVGLEHHGQIPFLGRQVIDHLAADEDLAPVRFLQPGDQAQRRGLAASGRPQEDRELAVLHPQRQVRHRQDVSRVGLGDPLQSDFSQRSAPPSSLHTRPQVSGHQVTLKNPKRRTLGRLTMEDAAIS